MLLEPLFLHGARQADVIAIIDDQGECTYGQVGMAAAGFAQLITSHTQLPRVGLLLPSGRAFVASFYGTLLAGKAVAPINFLLGDAEIAHCIRDSGIDTIVTIPQLAGRVEKLGLKIVDLTQLPKAGSIEPPSSLPSTPADQMAVLMYTSGTSGLPKGVPLSFGNLQTDVDAVIAYMDFQTRHKFLGIIPLFHVFGMIAMMLAPIQLGATAVYMARFSPVGAVNAIKKHGISLVLGVPSMFAAIARLKEASADDFKTIFAMISGGEPLPGVLYQAFLARFGVRLLEAYGMTETSLAISLNTPQRQKPGSVGKAIPGMAVVIMDDQGSILPVGEAGEICVKGPMVMKGYFNLPNENTAAFTRDGYYKTGDVGMVDAEGFLFITGRKKELIIIAGEKAAPSEIEQTLLAHPDVADAAVVGKKDASRGEVVLAFIVAREGRVPTLENLREFCRLQGLAQWKAPREIRIVKEFPRSASGKVLKRVLTETLAN
jgi:long-chain acyl-CoA synthetase